MAYATIAGLPVQYGLYCAVVPMLVYAALVTPRPLSVSTTSSIALITGATVVAVAGDEPAAVASTLAVVVGVVFLAGGVLRLGFVADFVSDSVLARLKVGMGLVIVADQLGVRRSSGDRMSPIAATTTMAPSTGLWEVSNTGASTRTVRAARPAVKTEARRVSAPAQSFTAVCDRPPPGG
jgi:sulfate permease, SulP family